MSDQGLTEEAIGENIKAVDLEYSVFKCAKCGGDKVIILQINGMTVVVCGKFMADGTGCQTQFPELQVKLVPIKENSQS